MSDYALTRSFAFVPALVHARGESRLARIFAVASGVILLSALAQVSIPLPFTPVPITGQTFGITLMALLWGRRLGAATMAAYLLLGAFGAPVFAAGRAGLAFGPTIGYLVGMFLAALWVGGLADRGWTRSFARAWLAALSGSVFVFGCGLTALSFFVPADALLASGLFPFLPGDLIKSATAAAIASALSRPRP